MSIDPRLSIAEVLGRPSEMGFNPGDSEFLCPFIRRACTKRSAAMSTPYPVCTIRNSGGHPICVCPKRFHQIGFLNDVIDHAWWGEKPKNPQIASEVKMSGFGNVDYVIADLSGDGAIGQFLSVELQAIDISGSVRDAYDGLLSSSFLEKKKAYGPNWKNVYKRYVNQLISKGFHHHHWGSKVVSVVQDEIYEYICSDATFMKSADVTSPDINIVFMAYKFTVDDSGIITPQLSKVEGTHHSALQSAILYKTPPSRGDFCTRISAALAR